MTYFEKISAECDKLTQKANKYLSGLEFIPNDQVMNRIYAKAKEIFFEANENWDAVPEWVAQTMDGWMPYSTIPRNGSIGFALGYSPASQDAHLRNLLEIVEGRETKELDFPVVVDYKNIN